MDSTEIKIFYGDKVLICSGTIITIGNDDTEFNIVSDKERLKLLMRFSDDEKNKDKISVKYDLLDSDTLRLTYVNFNNPLGSFTKEPIKMGTLNNRELYFVSTIKLLEGTHLREVVYSFYLRKEVTNG